MKEEKKRMQTEKRIPAGQRCWKFCKAMIKTEKIFAGSLVMILLCFTLWKPGKVMADTAQTISSDSIRQKESQISDAQKQKTDLENSLTDIKTLKSQLESEKSDLQGYIKSLDGNLTSIQNKIDKLKQTIEDKENKITETQEQLEKAVQKEQEQYAAMKKRVQFLYEREIPIIWKCF